MSSLDEECIMYIGRNRSGIDSGEIDYGIFSDKFDRMSVYDLESAMRTLKVLAQRLAERWIELRSTPEADVAASSGETPQSGSVGEESAR